MSIKKLLPSFLVLLLLMVQACTPYYPDQKQGIEERPWGVDYNFQLVTDSIVLQTDRPMHLLVVPDVRDSLVMYKNAELVVAQIEVIPEDSIDSVWVKVASDQFTQGWVHESELLQAVVPDNPISQFIMLFSNTHLLASVALLVLALVAWLIRRMLRQRFHMVHLLDIASPYPHLLCLTLAAATVVYHSMQMFVPQMWAQFYFHPTLNPFGQPLPLTLFLSLLWLLVILGIAAADDLRRSLPFMPSLLYVLSLFAVLSLVYVVFSVATLNYLGAFLWPLYAFWAVRRFHLYHRARYRCRRCGAPLHNNSRCTRCS